MASNIMPRATIRVRLPWPPSKNHYYTVANGRKILSAAGRAFLAEAVVALREQGWGNGRDPLEDRLRLVLAPHPPKSYGRRAWDITNRIDAAQDALVRGGVIDDDQLVDEFTVRRGVLADTDDGWAEFRIDVFGDGPVGAL